ncbi:MAG TPA: nuclear transport factor 2 family protein [Solirubrobacteraceae bacterium]|nr:nuclear transport factor 2 family protein [Solirubrobacteraceae bacterium]
MSENLDLVRSIYARWERGDFTGTDWADPEIEFVIADGPDPRSLKGLAAMAAGWREFLTAWTGYGVEPDEYRELSDGRVLVILHAVGRGKASGVQLGQTSERGANVHEIRGGKVTRLVIYFDCARALANLGLED